MRTKTKLIMVGLVFLLMSAGTTYAWFTAKFETAQSISMGSLHVSANFPSLSDPKNYEPGLDIEMNGEIKNNGTLPAMIKIGNSTQVRYMYADDNLTLIPIEEREFQKAPNSAVDMKITPTSGRYDDNEDAYWFRDKSTNDNYLLLEPKSSVNVMVTSKLNDEKIGNKFQGASFKLGTILQATQVLEDAMATELGLDLNNLDIVDNLETQSKVATSSKNTRALTRLNELLMRSN